MVILSKGLLIDPRMWMLRLFFFQLVLLLFSGVVGRKTKSKTTMFGVPLFKRHSHVPKMRTAGLGVVVRFLLVSYIATEKAPCPCYLYKVIGKLRVEPKYGTWTQKVCCLQGKHHRVVWWPGLFRHPPGSLVHFWVGFPFRPETRRPVSVK